MDMPTTIGTGPSGVAKPTPRFRSPSITPSLAARPNADPPESTTADTVETVRTGESSSNSRVAGAPPRTSPDPTVPSGGTITVTPVPAPVQCPAYAVSSCGALTTPSNYSVPECRHQPGQLRRHPRKFRRGLLRLLDTFVGHPG